MHILGADECKASASTCPCCNPCPKDTFKVELLSVRADKDLSQMSSLTEIYPGMPFAIRVTPYVDDVMAVVESCTGTTLTLNDATEFQAKGEGVIATECVPICFSWADKSGNTLTGVSPSLSGVVKGMKVRCQSHKTPWLNYAGTSPLEVKAWACRKEGTQTRWKSVPLDVTWMNYCWWNYWKNDPWVFETNQVLRNTFDADVDLWITVTERANPSTGRMGSAKVTLKQGTRTLRVAPSVYHVKDGKVRLTIENSFNETDYVDPSDRPNEVLNLSTGSPNTIEPPTINPAPWVNGQLSVDCTIQDLTGLVTITATVGTSGASGTAEVYVTGSEESRTSEIGETLWQPGYDQDETSPCSWNDVQYFVYDQFKTQANWGDNLPTAMQHVAKYGEPSYTYFLAGNMTGGYVRFNVNIAPGAIKACYLSCPASAYIYKGSDTSPQYLWSPYAHWYDLKVKLATAFSKGTGSQLRTAVGDGTVAKTFAWINASRIAHNFKHNDVTQRVQIPIDKTTLTTLLGVSSQIYALFFVEGRNVPLKACHFDAGGNVHDQPYHIAFAGRSGDPEMPVLVVIT